MRVSLRNVFQRYGLFPCDEFGVGGFEIVARGGGSGRMNSNKKGNICTRARNDARCTPAKESIFV